MAADRSRPAGGAPPPKLQKSPTGLLGAFSLKVGGLNPDIFGDTIVPTVDVYDQYLNQGEQQVRNVSIATVVGQPFVNATLTVPNFKCWRVLAVGGFVSMNAADVALIAQIGIGVVSPANPVTSALIGAAYPPQLGTSGRTVGFALRPPLFLTSGWQLSFGFTFSGNVTVAVANGAVGTALIQEFDA